MKFTTNITHLKTDFSVRNATNMAGSKIMLAYLEKIGLVTTEMWEAIDVWRFYNQRCCRV
ncbi:hypothetical protein [Paenibacillus herberti]|uniref:Uncharacterized protein n=1 Tax=Paenibacillus herberti TaxID=1619309 RepID=A0A229P2Z6_9BACL|nr:hypothetical protein [Paenibacillus herberti]OXM16265.1 hypothetical protein CGZ75_06125 [Paenibacillus herberti]